MTSWPDRRLNHFGTTYMESNLAALVVTLAAPIRTIFIEPSEPKAVSPPMLPH